MSVFARNLKQIKTNTGVGVISTVDIPKDTIIFEFKGDVMKESDIPTDANINYYLQIGKDNFLGPSGSFDDFFNHSCNPNCKVFIVGNRAFLISLYLIRAGTEITFDYSTTSTDTQDSWSMKCKCGDYNCRKTVSGYQYLDAATRKQYEDLGAVPKYVRDSVK